MNISKINEDVIFLKSEVYKDNRGSFFELYNKNYFFSLDIENNFVQDNISFSKNENTIRGLHCQNGESSQAKFVYLISGSIMDIFIDIKKNSPNFGKIFKVKLKTLGDCLYIPKGYLHGFCTLEENTIVGYKVDNYYSQKNESGVIWNDPDLNIKWPYKINPIVSKKDSSLHSWNEFKSILGC